LNGRHNWQSITISFQTKIAMANDNELPVGVISTKRGLLCISRYLLVKVVARYLTKEEYKAFEDDLLSCKQMTGPRFVAILNKHFDIERWRTSPIIKQDVWLYNYFKYEYKGKLVYTGLLRKYYWAVFVDDDIDFFKNTESLNQKKTRLPKGVKFIPNEVSPQPANHVLSMQHEPKQVN
jgi:hypothetical protein